MLWELGRTISLQLETDMLALRAAAPRLAGNWEGLGLGNAFLARNSPSLLAQDRTPVLSSALGPARSLRELYGRYPLLLLSE